MKSPGEAGSKDSAAEYSEMASSYLRSSTAKSPRNSSFLEKRRLKSDTKLSRKRQYLHGMCNPLTTNPFRQLGVRVRLPSQFAHHLLKTFGRILYLVKGLESFTDGPINCGFGSHKLQTDSVSSPRRIPEKMSTHTVSGRQDFFPRAISQF